MESYASLHKKFNILKEKKDQIEKIPNAILDVLIEQFSDMCKENKNSNTEYTILSLLSELKIEREFQALGEEVDTYLSDELMDYEPSEYIC
jgi:hypothetical protein